MRDLTWILLYFGFLFFRHKKIPNIYIRWEDPRVNEYNIIRILLFKFVKKISTQKQHALGNYRGAITIAKFERFLRGWNPFPLNGSKKRKIIFWNYSEEYIEHFYFY